MSNEGDSKDAKSGVLASIRRIMRGESADLGEVPAAGSKAEGDSTDAEDWSLPAGALSEEEGGEPAEPVDIAAALAQQTPPPAKTPDAEAGAEADDDVLPLSAEMMVPTAPAAPAEEDEAGAPGLSKGDGAPDVPESAPESALPHAEADAEAELFLTGAAALRRSADEPTREDGADEIVEEPAAEAPQDDWRLAESEPESELEDTAAVPDSPGDDSWNVTVDEPDAGPAEAAAGDDTMPADEWGWGVGEDAAAADDEAPAEGEAAETAEDGLPEMPALTLGEIEDTIRRVVREELEGEEDGRLTELIRRVVRQEVARATHDDD